MAQFKEEIEGFASRVQSLIIEHYKTRFPTLVPPAISVKFGRRYAKIIKTGIAGNQSVYGFVDADTGDIYKAATWKAPAKHIRGNIFSVDGGISSCNEHGINYL